MLANKMKGNKSLSALTNNVQMSRCLECLDVIIPGLDNTSHKNEKVKKISTIGQCMADLQWSQDYYTPLLHKPYQSGGTSACKNIPLKYKYTIHGPRNSEFNEFI